MRKHKQPNKRNAQMKQTTNNNSNTNRSMETGTNQIKQNMQLKHS